MTQTLANRMMTAPDQVFVACNPLQAREEMLEGNQMAETHGGIPPLLPILGGFLLGVATSVTANLISNELTSEESDNTDVNVNVNVNITCGCDG